MIDSKNQRSDVVGTVVVIGAGAEVHRSTRPRMTGFAGGWYGEVLQVTTPPAIRPSGAESRS